jgi:membrane protease YdiL (CAAX protease family)
LKFEQRIHALPEPSRVRLATKVQQPRLRLSTRTAAAGIWSGVHSLRPNKKGKAMKSHDGPSSAASAFSFPWRGGFFVALAAFALAFLGLLFTGAVTTLAQGAVASLPVFSGMDPMLFGAAWEFFSYLVMFSSSIFLLHRLVTRENLFSITGFTLSDLKHRFGRTLGFGLLGWFCAIAATATMYAFFPLPEPQSPAGDFARTLSGPAFLFFVASAVIAAPILEELLFRGLLQNMLRSGMRSNWIGRKSVFAADMIAILVTGALFSAMHGTLSGFPPLFITGFVLGFVYYKTNNLWVAVTMHAINNLIATLAILAAMAA